MGVLSEPIPGRSGAWYKGYMGYRVDLPSQLSIQAMTVRGTDALAAALELAALQVQPRPAPDVDGLLAWGVRRIWITAREPYFFLQSLTRRTFRRTLLAVDLRIYELLLEAEALRPWAAQAPLNR